MDALLLYLVDLTVKSGLCVLVLFGPPVLTCATAYRLHTKKTRYTKKQLVLCNLSVGVLIVAAATFLQLGTLRTNAIAAYIVVIVLLAIFTLLTFVRWLVSLCIAHALSIRQQIEVWRAKQRMTSGRDINASRVRL